MIIFFSIGCQEPLSTTENNRVVFHTSDNSYFTTDSIQVLIENNTHSKFEIALRCGSYLEMYYQRKEKNNWSEKFWFSWMSLKCISLITAIKENHDFQFIIPDNEIDSIGIYRLILANDTSIVSNSFEIK